jgi:hypothetical protein
MQGQQTYRSIQSPRHLRIMPHLSNLQSSNALYLVDQNWWRQRNIPMLSLCQNKQTVTNTSIVSRLQDQQSFDPDRPTNLL